MNPFTDLTTLPGSEFRYDGFRLERLCTDREGRVWMERWMGCLNEDDLPMNFGNPFWVGPEAVHKFLLLRLPPEVLERMTKDEISLRKALLSSVETYTYVTSHADGSFTPLERVQVHEIPEEALPKEGVTQHGHWIGTDGKRFDLTDKVSERRPGFQDTGSLRCTCGWVSSYANYTERHNSSETHRAQHLGTVFRKVKGIIGVMHVGDREIPTLTFVPEDA
jgi:hypothetical protein